MSSVSIHHRTVAVGWAAGYAPEVLAEWNPRAARLGDVRGLEKARQGLRWMRNPYRVELAPRGTREIVNEAEEWVAPVTWEMRFSQTSATVVARVGESGEGNLVIATFTAQAAAPRVRVRVAERANQTVAKATAELLGHPEKWQRYLGDGQDAGLTRARLIAQAALAGTTARFGELPDR